MKSYKTPYQFCYLYIKWLLQETKIDKSPIIKEPINIPRPEVKITPQQDKYNKVNLQKREPAYVRLRAQFEVESDTQQRVNYQQQRATTEDATTDAGGGMFQF